MTDKSQLRVWDILVRFFHWSLAGTFIIAYLTEDDFLTIHSWAGYSILMLLAVRVIWGFTGTKHARFKDFVYSPETIIQFLRDTIHLNARRYIGHNPAGGAMVLLLMISLLLTTISGIVLLGLAEQAGPVGHWFYQTSFYWAEILEEVHEFFANFTLLLVFVHVAGVIVESLIHKENLVSAMITGIKVKTINSHKES